KSDFEGAVMHEAGFIAADLRGANLYHIQARQALFIRTDLRGADMRGADLLGAILQKARLEGTDLSGCNLSRGDISLARTDDGTKMEGALMLNTRVDPVYTPPDESHLDGARRAAEGAS
ncbi:MAG: pentapeptide repeat-containing protein, partial [Polyangiaceae bacterium]